MDPRLRGDDGFWDFLRDRQICMINRKVFNRPCGFALLLRRPEIFKSHPHFRRQLDETGQGLADVAFTISTMGQALGDAAFADFTAIAVKEFDAIRFAAITMDLLGEDFGLVHPGPFLGGGFPFGVAVFQRCPVGIALGTIQTTMGNHINSSVARDHGLIGHGFFIYESIIRKGGISLPLLARINCF